MTCLVDLIDLFLYLCHSPLDSLHIFAVLQHGVHIRVVLEFIYFPTDTHMLDDGIIE